MEFSSTYKQLTTAPPLYDLTLKIGDTANNGLPSVQFVQRVAYNTGDVDFSGLIEAVNEKKDFQCTYSSYGILTEYVVLKGVFVINRVGNGGNTRIDINLETHHDFAKEHVQNLQDCLKKCAELGKKLPEDVVDFIKHNQNTALVFSQFQQKTVGIIHRLVNEAQTPVVEIDTEKAVDTSDLNSLD